MVKTSTNENRLQAETNQKSYSLDSFTEAGIYEYGRGYGSRDRRKQDKRKNAKYDKENEDNRDVIKPRTTPKPKPSPKKNYDPKVRPENEFRPILKFKRFSSMSEKELTSLFYQYGIKVKRKKNASPIDTRITKTTIFPILIPTPTVITKPGQQSQSEYDVLKLNQNITHPPGFYIKQQTGTFNYKLNKTSKLRAACRRGLMFSEMDETEFAKLPSLKRMRECTVPIATSTPPRTQLLFTVPENPVRFNRTSRMRYLYNHLPPPIRTRHGVFEVAGDSYKKGEKKTISKKGTIDGIRYVIEEIRSDSKGGKKAAKQLSKEVKASPKTREQHARASGKRDNDLRLRLRREMRIRLNKRLPFKC